MTQITVKQLAAAKRIAANVNPLVTRKARLQKEIDDRMQEIETLKMQIDAQQGYVKSFANGLTTEDIIVRNPITKAYEANLEKLGWDDNEHVWFLKEEETTVTTTAAPAEFTETITTTEEATTVEETVGAIPTAEEIAAAEEAAREEEIARMEAEQKAAEEARQAEIRAAKERLTASKPQPAAPVEETPENDPFAN